MSIFSRRNIARLLQQNRKFLTKKQLRQHVAHLNGVDEIRRVTAEWELMILNALHKLGGVVHEPQVPGPTKIDARFAHETETALIEVTSVSDRGLDEANPIGQLCEELMQRVRTAGLDPSHFSLDVKGNFRELRPGGPRARLYMPRSHQSAEMIFTDAFYRFLEEARTSPISSAFCPSLVENMGVTICFKPNQTFFLCSYLDYTVPFASDDNPVYSRLLEKAQQLEKSQSPEWKGIVVCDGGSSVLRRQGRRGTGFGTNEIISTFLARSDSVAFVLAIMVASDGSGLLGPDHLEVVSKSYLSRRHPAAAPLVQFLQANLCNNLPRPETTPVNGYSVDDQGRSFYGGGRMAGTTIRISARTVLEVHSGQTAQEKYLRDNQMFSAQFARFLREGRLLEHAQSNLARIAMMTGWNFAFLQRTPPSPNSLADAARLLQSEPQTP
jgi:hypothetical protein